MVLEQFNPLLQVVKLKLEGRMNGNITLSNVNNNFAFNGDVTGVKNEFGQRKVIE